MLPECTMWWLWVAASLGLRRRSTLRARGGRCSSLTGPSSPAKGVWGGPLSLRRGRTREARHPFRGPERIYAVEGVALPRRPRHRRGAHRRFRRSRREVASRSSLSKAKPWPWARPFARSIESWSMSKCPRRYPNQPPRAMSTEGTQSALGSVPLAGLMVMAAQMTGASSRVPLLSP